jgi:hypothetical protein
MRTPRRNAAKPKTRKFSEELPCKLSRDEYEIRAELLAKQLKAITAKEEQAKLQAKKFKDELTSLELEKNKLIEALETHNELRMIECEEVADFDTNRIVVRRLDTGDIVRQRPMDGDERSRLAQGELPVEETPKNGAGAEA